MEVHQPEHPMHSWKDFMNHMFTLTLGLLLALALEAGAEKMHRMDERHQLEDELRMEAQRNEVIAAGDYVYYDAVIRWTLATQQALDGLHGGTSAATPTYQQPPSQINDLSPSSAVWIAAKDSGLLAVLPRAEAQLYARVYHQHDTMETFHQRYRDTLFERESFECRFSRGTYPCAPNLSSMDDADRKEYSGLLAKNAVAAFDMKLRIDHVSGADQAVLHGAKTEDDVIRGIDAMLQRPRNAQGLETTPAAQQ